MPSRKQIAANGRTRSPKKKKVKPKSGNGSQNKKPVRVKAGTVEDPKLSQFHRLNEALNAAGIGVWEWDIQTGSVVWSDVALQIFGNPNFDGSLDGYIRLLHPADKDRVLETVRKSLERKSHYFIQHRVVWPDQSVHWVEAYGDVVYDKKGAPLKMTGCTKDITALKEMDQQKEDWKIRYDMIVAASGQVIYDYDLSSGEILWSGNIEQVLGYTAVEMGDINTWGDLIHPDDREETFRKLELAQQHVRKFDVLYRFRKKNGDYLALHDIGFFMSNAENEPYRMLGTMQDISEKMNSQEAIRKSDLFRETVTNAMPGVIYVVELETSATIYANRSLLSFLGYTPEEIESLGTGFMKSLTHPDDYRRLPTWGYEKIGTVKESHYRMLHRNGEWRWFISRDSPFQHDDSGRVTQVIGLAQDITESKLAEQRLLESEQSYRELFETVGEAIYIQDLDGTFIDVNRGACMMYGYRKEEFIGKTPAFLSADGRNDFEQLANIVQNATQGVQQVFEWWGKKKNGDVFLKEVRINKGTYFGKDILIATAFDITEQRKVVDALRESEQRFRTLQQASFGGIGLHDQGYILDCNQGLCDISGYSYSELVGSNGLELIAPEWRPVVIENITNGREKTYDVEGIRKDGTRYFLEIQAKNIPYQGRTIRVTEFRDITDRKKSEEKIIEQNAKLLALTDDLKRKNEQLEEFTQIVSHNLRSPVGNILTLLSFFEGAASEEERSEYLKLLKESGGLTLNTLHELNDVLKIKQNKNIEKQDLSFEEIFTVVKSMLSANITETGATVRGNFSGAPRIQYPRIYLESILLNLLSNALKYISPERPPVIEFKTYYYNGHLMLEASDNGLGLNLDRYGHQVFKLRKTFHRHPESRGIGLFMIKNQIEVMGGEITLRSIEHEGTTFYVNFTRHLNEETTDGN